MENTETRLALKGWLTAAAVALVAFAIGFMWLPSLQSGGQDTLWDAICRAAGVFRSAPPASIASSSAQIPTAIAWNGTTSRTAASGDAKRGGALAAACAACHGAKGISPAEAFPSLAGMPADAVYKQLEDYRAGKRQNPIMQGMSAALDDQKIADLAAHFATLPGNRVAPDEPAPALVVHGNPLRSIAPCAACHGPLGRKPGAPALAGQKRGYLKAQLDAFASGARHNDINEQMREVARALTPAEREALADWYGHNGHPQ